MTAFDAAWSVAKAPLWTESGTTADYEPEEPVIRGGFGAKWAESRYHLIPTINASFEEGKDEGIVGPARFWESRMQGDTPLYEKVMRLMIRLTLIINSACLRWHRKRGTKV